MGHPEGALKKWTDGQVTDANGQWITTTAYTLPGDSGSPILNDQGQVIGLLHRGPTSEDLFAENGVDMYSLGTASAPIVAAMAAPASPPLVSAIAATLGIDRKTVRVWREHGGWHPRRAGPRPCCCSSGLAPRTRS